MTDARALLALTLGATVGAILRHAVGLWAQRLGSTWPLGTLLINVLGSFGLGLFLGWLAPRPDVPPEVRLLGATGFFGAFTTFSTFSVEVLALMQRQQGGAALAYGLNSVLLGVGGAWLGGWLAGRWLTPP